jgi:hypothetical protein
MLQALANLRSAGASKTKVAGNLISPSPLSPLIYSYDNGCKKKLVKDEMVRDMCDWKIAVAGLHRI